MKHSAVEAVIKLASDLDKAYHQINLLMAFIAISLPTPPEGHWYSVIDEEIMMLGPEMGHCSDDCNHAPFAPICLKEIYQKHLEKLCTT